MAPNNKIVKVTAVKKNVSRKESKVKGKVKGTGGAERKGVKSSGRTVGGGAGSTRTRGESSNSPSNTVVSNRAQASRRHQTKNCPDPAAKLKIGKAKERKGGVPSKDQSKTSKRKDKLRVKGAKNEVKGSNAGDSKQRVKIAQTGNISPKSTIKPVNTSVVSGARSKRGQQLKGKKEQESPESTTKMATRKSNSASEGRWRTGRKQSQEITSRNKTKSAKASNQSVKSTANTKMDTKLSCQDNLSGIKPEIKSTPTMPKNNKKDVDIDKKTTLIKKEKRDKLHKTDKKSKSSIAKKRLCDMNKLGLLGPPPRRTAALNAAAINNCFFDYSMPFKIKIEPPDYIEYQEFPSPIVPNVSNVSEKKQKSKTEIKKETNSESCKASVAKLDEKKEHLKKKTRTIKLAKFKKLKADKVDIKELIVGRRMASLNASAKMTASYAREVDRKNPLQQAIEASLKQEAEERKVQQNVQEEEKALTLKIDESEIGDYQPVDTDDEILEIVQESLDAPTYHGLSLTPDGLLQRLPSDTGQSIFTKEISERVSSDLDEIITTGEKVEKVPSDIEISITKDKIDLLVKEKRAVNIPKPTPAELTAKQLSDIVVTDENPKVSTQKIQNKTKSDNTSPIIEAKKEAKTKKTVLPEPISNPLSESDQKTKLIESAKLKACKIKYVSAEEKERKRSKKAKNQQIGHETKTNEFLPGMKSIKKDGQCSVGDAVSSKYTPLTALASLRVELPAAAAATVAIVPSNRPFFVHAANPQSNSVPYKRDHPSYFATQSQGYFEQAGSVIKVDSTTSNPSAIPPTAKVQPTLIQVPKSYKSPAPVTIQPAVTSTFPQASMSYSYPRTNLIYGSPYSSSQTTSNQPSFVPNQATPYPAYTYPAYTYPAYQAIPKQQSPMTSTLTFLPEKPSTPTRQDRWTYNVPYVSPPPMPSYNVAPASPAPAAGNSYPEDRRAQWNYSSPYVSPPHIASYNATPTSTTPSPRNVYPQGSTWSYPAVIAVPLASPSIASADQAKSYPYSVGGGVLAQPLIRPSTNTFSPAASPCTQSSVPRPQAIVEPSATATEAVGKPASRPTQIVGPIAAIVPSAKQTIPVLPSVPSSSSSSSKTAAQTLRAFRKQKPISKPNDQLENITPTILNATINQDLNKQGYQQIMESKVSTLPLSTTMANKIKKKNSAELNIFEALKNQKVMKLSMELEKKYKEENEAKATTISVNITPTPKNAAEGITIESDKELLIKYGKVNKLTNAKLNKTNMNQTNESHQNLPMKRKRNSQDLPPTKKPKDWTELVKMQAIIPNSNVNNSGKHNLPKIPTLLRNRKGTGIIELKKNPELRSRKSSIIPEPKIIPEARKRKHSTISVTMAKSAAKAVLKPPSSNTQNIKQKDIARLRPVISPKLPKDKCLSVTAATPKLNLQRSVVPEKPKKDATSKVKRKSSSSSSSSSVKRGRKKKGRKKLAQGSVDDSPIGDPPIPWCLRSGEPAKLSNGWSWSGEPYVGRVRLNSEDERLVWRICYPRIHHKESKETLERRQSVLMASETSRSKGGLPHPAKIISFWENPDDGTMMLSLIWYYRPEHTSIGRLSADLADEVFASKHLDYSAIACIEDKCYVLTYSEYCRYQKHARMVEGRVHRPFTQVPTSTDVFHRVKMIPNQCVPEDRLFVCQREYDTKKNSVKPRKKKLPKGYVME